MSDDKPYELKPCPFCGGKGAFVEELDTSAGRSFFVACSDMEGCLTDGPARPTPAEAVTAWNHRP